MRDHVRQTAYPLVDLDWLGIAEGKTHVIMPC